MMCAERTALRRCSLVCLVALTGALTLALAARAQETATPVALRSFTRADYRAQLAAHYRFSTPEHRGGTVIASAAGDITGTNPVVVNDTGTQTVLGLVFLGLWGISPLDGQPVPSGLADRWEVGADGTTYTFHLNQAARWHDSVDVTADDVVFSFDAQANEATGSAFTGAFRDSVASYRAVDPDTVELVATEVLADLLLTLYAPILPKHVWGSVPFQDWTSDPGSTGQDSARVVGSGPFRFEAWVPGDHVALVRNDAHFDIVPAIDRYVLQVLPDNAAATTALLTGAVDINVLQPADVPTAQGTSGITVAVYPTMHVNLYLTNLDPDRTTLFQDRRVRQALFYALDREAIVRTIEQGHGQGGPRDAAQASIAHAPERMTTRYGYDPDKARRLLAEAGWVDANGDGVVEKDGQELRFDLIYESGQATVSLITTYFQDAWRAIGVAMTPVSYAVPGAGQGVDDVRLHDGGGWVRLGRLRQPVHDVQLRPVRRRVQPGEVLQPGRWTS